VYFDTADVDAREREAFVGDILCNGVVPLEIEHLGRAGQGVELRLFSAELGPLNLQSLRSSATAFKRTARLVRDGSPPTVVLAVHRAGLTSVCQEDREAVLGAGDLSIVSSTRSSAILSGHRSSSDLVRIPAELLAVPEAALRQAVAVRAGHELVLAGVLGRLVADLATLPDLQSAEAEHLAQPTVDLVRALIATVLGDAPRAREPLQATLQVRVIDYLRVHWRERDLTAGRIAAAHHVSSRQLYRLLAAEGISLGGWLRERRLEACRDELARPAAAGVTVASVGRRWGFSDATNFGRAFKAAYGVTPLEWRMLNQKTQGGPTARNSGGRDGAPARIGAFPSAPPVTRRRPARCGPACGHARGAGDA
jgi:AraC-like DNA-binding protein